MQALFLNYFKTNEQIKKKILHKWRDFVASWIVVFVDISVLLQFAC